MIDPGLDAERLLTEIKSSGLNPLAVLSTHGHFDHIGSAANLQREFNIPFYLHQDDYKLSQSANFFLQLARISHKIKTPQPDIIFKNVLEKIQIASFKIEVHQLPGHSPGSCVFKYNNYLFTGDIIYKNGLGPESIPKEDKVLLKSTIQRIFAKFPDDSLVLPGHGPSDTLGNIKNNNLELSLFVNNPINANT